MSVYTIRRRSVEESKPATTTSKVCHADSSFCAQATRIRSMQAAYRKAEAANPRDDAPQAGEVRNLGLLEKVEDRKKFLSSK